jgi:hypothetical protein
LARVIHPQTNDWSGALKKTTQFNVWLSLFLCLSVSGFAVPAAPGVDDADKKEIVKQAHAAYYNAKTQGLIEFQANVAPNWRIVLKDQLATNPEGAEKALKMLNGIHFTVSLDPQGIIKVAHRADVAPANESAAKGFEQIFTGMEQTMSGFFDTWKPFMFTSPFPEVDSEYQLVEKENQYYLSYKEDATDVVTTMSKDFAISELKVTAAGFKSSLKPRFKKGPQGFLMTGYTATYQGATATDTVQLQVEIDYQEVNGVQLPRSLNLSGNYQGTAFAMEMTFSNYDVKKR